ncbi:MAG: SemiSWEET family transporter, partial [bacterium]
KIKAAIAILHKKFSNLPAVKPALLINFIEVIKYAFYNNYFNIIKIVYFGFSPDYYYFCFYLFKEKNMAEKLGFAAMTVTILYTCFGLPTQFVKNCKRKSTEGVSFFLIFISACGLLLWSIYAYIKIPRDWYIIISNFPGFIIACAVLYQFRLYGKKD